MEGRAIQGTVLFTVASCTRASGTFCEWVRHWLATIWGGNAESPVMAIGRDPGGGGERRRQEWADAAVWRPLIVCGDQETWDALVLDLGVPEELLFVDAFPTPPGMWGAKKDRAVSLKWLYASLFATWGYEVIFNDVDVVYRRPPEALLQAVLFRPWGAKMDFVALSDNTNDVNYWMQDEDTLARRSWIGHDSMSCILYPRCVRYPNPCLSTGLWVAQPVATTKQFLFHMAHKVTRDTTWEQSAANTLLGMFLDYKIGPRRPVHIYMAVSSL